MAHTQDDSAGRILRSAKRKLPDKEDRSGGLLDDQETDEFAAAVLKSTQSYTENNANAAAGGINMVLRSRTRDGERKKYNFTPEELECYNESSGDVGGKGSGRSRGRKTKVFSDGELDDSDSELRISEGEEDHEGGGRKKKRTNAKQAQRLQALKSKSVCAAKVKPRRAKKKHNSSGKAASSASSSSLKGRAGKRQRRDYSDSSNSASDADDDMNVSVGVEALMGLAESALLLGQQTEVTEDKKKVHPAAIATGEYPPPRGHTRPSIADNHPLDLTGNRDSAWSKASSKSSLPKLIPFATDCTGLFSTPASTNTPSNIGGTPRQRTWKRCATHVATAYYIFYQQRHNLLQTISSSASSNPATQKFLLPFSLDPTFEARMLKEKSEALKRKQPNNTPLAPAGPTQTPLLNSTSSKPTLGAIVPSLPPLPLQPLQQLQPQPSKVTSSTPTMFGVAPNRLSTLPTTTPLNPNLPPHMQAQLMQQLLAAQMHPSTQMMAAQLANNAAAQQRLLNTAQQFPFLNLQQSQLVRNNPGLAMRSGAGAGMGPLNPFSLNPQTGLPGIASMPTLPLPGSTNNNTLKPLFVSGQPVPQPAASSPSSSSSNTQQRKGNAVSLPSPVQQSQVTALIQQRLSQQPAAGKLAQNSGGRKKKAAGGSPKVSSPKPGSPPTNVSAASPPGGSPPNAGGIMHRVLLNETASATTTPGANGGSRTSPPSPPTGGLVFPPSGGSGGVPPALPSLPLKADPLNKILPAPVPSASLLKQPPSMLPPLASTVPSPSFLPSLSRELPMDNTSAKATSVPFSPKKGND